MAYRFRRSESVQAGIQRMAREQVDSGLAELRDAGLDRDEAIHQIRKRCKKIRALLRLVRPAIGELYQQENAFYRDLAGELSRVRDAQSVIETYEALLQRAQGDVDHLFTAVAAGLAERRTRIARGELDLDARLAELEPALEAARDRIAHWDVNAKGFDALQGGLCKTYGRGRRALPQAYAKNTTEAFHEWRKRVKYHCYHLRILTPCWKPVLKPQRAALSRLADLLGDEHDLGVLREILIAEPQAFGGEHTVGAFLELLDSRREELRAEARPRGERLLCESPKALAHRLQCYWTGWRGR